MDCSNLVWLVPLTIFFMWISGFIFGKAHTEKNFVRTLENKKRWKPPKMAMRPLKSKREGDDGK